MVDRDPITIALIGFGLLLMVAAILFPSQSVEVILKPLSLIIEVTPQGIKIKGTQIDAAFLEFAIGAILLVWGLMRGRRQGEL